MQLKCVLYGSSWLVSPDISITEDSHTIINIIAVVRPYCSAFSAALSDKSKTGNTRIRDISPVKKDGVDFTLGLPSHFLFDFYEISSRVQLDDRVPLQAITVKKETSHRC